MSSTDGIVCAIRISPHGAEQLCIAAGITPPKWEDREWADIDVQRQVQSLTRRPLHEIVSDDDILSRRPYRCAICDGTFTVRQFDHLQKLSRRSGTPRPFDSGHPIHEECSARA